MTKLKNWIGLKNCIGLFALLLSFQVNGSEITVQNAWIRTLATGQEDAMVGMVIKSDRQARIVSVISPAYKFVAMQGPGKSGANKTQELEFISLPAQTSVVLGAESMHLLLSGNTQTLGASDNIPVIVTVKFDDNTRKIVTIMAVPVNSRSAVAMPLSSNVETKTVTPPPQPAPSKAMASPVEVASPAKPVAPPKPPVAEVKPIKAVPVAVPKPAPAPVAARVAAPVPTPVATPVPVVAPSVAPLTVEPKKAPEAKPAEPPKQDEARASAECLKLADEIRNCDKSNDMMLAWCETNAKSKYSCQLSMEQLKKLRN